MVSQELFWKFVMDVRETPFVWGEHDCCLMAAKMLDATRGTSYVAQMKSKFPYTSATEGLRLMKDGLQPRVESLLGPAKPWAWCHMGDVVLMKDPDVRLDMLAIHDGTNLLGAGANGLEKLRKQYAVCGWSP